MVRLRLSGDKEEILEKIDGARKSFAEHLGISQDIMNHIFSKGRTYWEFCIGNRDKIEVRRAEDSKNIEYVLKDRALVFRRSRAENIGFFQYIKDCFKDELIINENSMDALMNYIYSKPKLRKKYDLRI